ncbi:MAG: hypothetical protein WAO91_10510 [Candidatus Nitrosotenuis sp.]
MSSLNIPKVSIKDALEYARFELYTIVTPVPEGFERPNISKKPQLIYDLNGSLLFYEFSILRKGREIGTMKIDSNMFFTSPVVTLELGESEWNVKKAREKAETILKQKYPYIKDFRTKLVCYSFPKIGVGIFSQREREALIIVDVTDYSVAPSEEVSEERNTEGFGKWSLYDEMKEHRQRAAKEWEEFKTKLSEMKRKIAGKSKKFAIKTITDIVKFQHKTVQYCTHGKSHFCFKLHGQENYYYCTVACCQMILDYYRYYFQQNFIANSMNVINGGGAFPIEQVSCINHIANHHLTATLDTAPTWEKARDEINNNRPLKEGIKRHARVCVGWN